jgi:hypothetical protein
MVIYNNTMNRESKIKQQLQNSANYEKYIDTEFKNRVIREDQPQQQQLPVIDTTDENRLQANIARENLKTLNLGPGLINEIITYVNNNSSISDLNKYFPLFSKAINYRQLRDLQEFITEWQLFESQRIGQKLSPTPPTVLNVIEDKTLYKKEDLEGMTTQKLDLLFRMHLMKEKKKPIDDISTFTYKKADGGVSALLKINNVDGIISFTGAGARKVKDKTLEQINNEIKIRYIYSQMYPFAPGLKSLNWSPAANFTTSTTSTSTEGTGLLPSTPIDRFLKKNSVLMSFR